MNKIIRAAFGSFDMRYLMHDTYKNAWAKGGIDTPEKQKNFFENIENPNVTMFDYKEILKNAIERARKDGDALSKAMVVISSQDEEFFKLFENKFHKNWNMWENLDKKQEEILRKAVNKIADCYGISHENGEIITEDLESLKKYYRGNRKIEVFEIGGQAYAADTDQWDYDGSITAWQLNDDYEAVNDTYVRFVSTPIGEPDEDGDYEDYETRWELA
jgi:hypothetical protein